MEIYFRATIEYDMARCGIDSISFEYSLEDFDRNEHPIRGLYQYSSHTIPDYYSSKEAKCLCEKMIDEFDENGVSLSATLVEQLEIKKAFIESLKYSDRFIVVDSDFESIYVSVFKVARDGNNEDGLVDTINVRVEDIDGRGLNWFTLYSGIKLAPVYLEGDELYLLENDGNDIRVVKKNGFAITYSEDYDDEYMIATKIYCSSRKISR